jgi:hypothetical protein
MHHLDSDCLSNFTSLLNTIYVLVVTTGRQVSNSWLGHFALWKCFPLFLASNSLSTVPAFSMIDTALVGLDFVNRDIRAQAICMRSYGEIEVLLHELRSIYWGFFF